MNHVLSLLLILQTNLFDGLTSDQSVISELNQKAKSFLGVNRDSACYFANEAFHLLVDQKGEFPVEEGRNFLLRGMCQKYEGQKDSAYQLFDRARSIFETRNTPKDLGTSYWYLGKVWHELDQFEKAKPLYIKAAEVLKNSGEYETQMKVINGMAVMEARQSNYNKSLEYFLECLSIAHREGFEKDYHRFYSNISSVYGSLKNFEKALEFNSRAIKLSDTLKNTNLLIGALGNRATLFSKQNQKDSVIFYNEMALDLSKKFNVDKGTSYYQYFRYYNAMKDYRNAIIYLRKIVKEGLLIPRLGSIYLQLGDKYAELDMLDSALYFSEKAYVLAVDKKKNKKIYQSAKLLSEIYSKMNRLKLANEYLSKYTAFKDSVFNEEKSKKLADLRVKIETIDKANEIELLESQAEIDKLNRLSIIRMAWAIVVGAVLVIISILLWYRNRQKRQILKSWKLTNDLERSKKDLHMQTLHMIRINNKIEEIEEKLKELKPRVNGESTGVQRLINTIRINKSLEKEWDNFNIYFKDIHPFFIEYLKREFPSLSLNEIRLCALLKLNLSNKEIASILNIESRSATMSKYRLKKKLNLPEDKDIADFLDGLEAGKLSTSK